MTGRQGEDIAVNFLVSKGYGILERNYRANRGEIDIVASLGGNIIFVEVKARKNRRYSAAREAVTAEKQKRIIRAATAYMSRKNDTDALVRFDVMEVYEDKVVHIRRAFDLPPEW